MVAYTLEGMFGSRSDFKRTKKVVYGGVVGGERLWKCRAGHFCVVTYFRVALSLMVALFGALLLAMMVGGYYVGVSADVSVTVLQGYLLLLGQAYTAFIVVTVVCASFAWYGTPVLESRLIAGVTSVVSVVYCASGQGKRASGIMTAAGVYSWWINSRGSHRSINHYHVISIVGAITLISLYALTDCVVLCLLMWLTQSILQHKRRLKGAGYSQLEVVVDNKRRGDKRVLTEDEHYCVSATGLPFDMVPEDVLKVATRMPVTADQRIEFRRWAQVGDVVLELMVVHYGVKTGASVQQISELKQRFTTRQALASMLMQHGQEIRYRAVNGVQSTDTAAEIYEAMIGVSWWFNYSRGADAAWVVDFERFAVNRLGLSV